jgi:hypothetical protein
MKDDRWKLQRRASISARRIRPKKRYNPTVHHVGQKTSSAMSLRPRSAHVRIDPSKDPVRDVEIIAVLHHHVRVAVNPFVRQ